MKRWSTLLVVGLVCAHGCEYPATPPSTPPVSTRKPDDLQAVKTLKQAGGVLRMNKQGSVISVDFRNSQAGQADLVYLKGFPYMEQLWLFGPNFNDESLQHLQANLYP